VTPAPSRTAESNALRLLAIDIRLQARCGLLGRSGSAPDVGVSGYTFGGGVGWLARSEGMAAAALRTVDYVDGRGTIRRAAEDADDLADRDALWAFRGGGGVGVAARLEFGLAAVHDLWAGYLLWPIEHLEAVISAWAAALPRVGPALATTISVLHAPRFPPFPESLRGTPVIHLALASPQGPEHASSTGQQRLTRRAPGQDRRGIRRHFTALKDRWRHAHVRGSPDQPRRLRGPARPPAPGPLGSCELKAADRQFGHPE
jgi:hypothetical protein